MIGPEEKNSIYDFIYSTKKQREGSDFVKELVLTPFADCTMDALCDEIVENIHKKIKNKTHEHNLNVLIIDYFMAIKSIRDFDIVVLENMLDGSSPNYNKGRAYIMYMDEKARDMLAFKVFEAMMKNEQQTNFAKGLSTHAIEMVVNNNFEETFYNVCKVLYSDTKIPETIEKIQNGLKEFKNALQEDDQEKATEISNKNDELRNELENLIKTEYDKAILLPNDIEL